MAIPHLSYPLRFANDRIATNEQDTNDDVVSCVAVVLLHHPGDRELMPEFGVLDLTFMKQPLDLATIIAAVDKWEPRAAQNFAQIQSSVDPLIVTVIDNIASRETAGV